MTRGVLYLVLDEDFDTFVADCLADVLEGFENRLSFEVWADERESQ